jgi:hypothetical protein
MVASDRRGLASGVKNLLEIAGEWRCCDWWGFMENYSSDGSGSGWLWLSLGSLGLVCW